jgi:predicted alpha/beta-fold hydrolase
VSAPLLLNVCATKLDKGFSKLYRANLLRELKHYIFAKQQHLDNIGATQEADKLKQLGDLSSIHSFWQYDDRVVAPLHGFANAHDYYQRSSARQFLKTITVPTLLIQALDDPFMTPDVLPRLEELSPTVQLEITPSGGHVGFITGKNPCKPIYWLEQRILGFLLTKSVTA